MGRNAVSQPLIPRNQGASVSKSQSSEPVSHSTMIERGSIGSGRLRQGMQWVEIEERLIDVGNVDAGRHVFQVGFDVVPV